MPPAKMSNLQGQAAFVFSGVRPSSGAETLENDSACEISDSLERAEVAAAEDGRTPANRYQAGSLPCVGRAPSVPAVVDFFPVGSVFEFRAVVGVVAAQAVHLSEFEVLQLPVLARVILHVVIPAAVTGFAGDIL